MLTVFPFPTSSFANATVTVAKSRREGSVVVAAGADKSAAAGLVNRRPVMLNVVAAAVRS